MVAGLQKTQEDQWGFSVSDRQMGNSVVKSFLFDVNG